MSAPIVASLSRIGQRRGLRRALPLRFAIIAMVAAVMPGCASDTVRVALEAKPPLSGDPQALEIRAQLSGPMDGLRYKWFSVSGDCDPQESESPETVFTFANGAMKDRVSVEIWRGAERIARSELDVAMDAQEIPPDAPKVDVAVTTIPPYEPYGGPDTRSEIAGTVTGPVAPGYKVVIYARADVWYIQPHPAAFHEIGADGGWKSWTHTGSSYAALVVRQPYNAQSRLDVLPQLGGPVLARTIVEGARR